MSEPDQDINEREALAALLVSDGWQVFTKHIEHLWGPKAYAASVDALLAAGKQKDRSVEADLYELGAAARTANVLAQWPVTRLASLKAQAEAKKPAIWRRA